MIDERTEQLIQADLDGELDEAGRSELEAALAGSEGARRFRSEMSRLAGRLDSIAEVDPPEGLYDQIIERVALPRESGLRRLLDFAAMPAFMRYGFATAAGLLLAVVIYENGRELSGSQDFSSMVGTMTLGGPEGYTRVLDSFSFENEGVSGSASFERRNGAYVVQIRLDSADDVDFRVDFAGGGLSLNAFAQMDSELRSLQYADDIVSGSGTGHQRFVVLLHRDDGGVQDAGGSIGLAFSRRGEVFHEGRLDTGW